MITNNKIYDGQSIDQIIRSSVKRSGSSFFWAMRLMAPQKRNAMYAVYACVLWNRGGARSAPPENFNTYIYIYIYIYI